MNTSGFDNIIINAQDEKIRGELKQLIKSRIFRGFYIERRYEKTIESYRDIIALHTSEQELQKILTCVKTKAEIYDELTGKTKRFIGITENGTAKQSDMLDTALWVNLDNLAFGQYWFCIKTLHFLDNEVTLKLKIVRPVDLATESTTGRPKSFNSETGSLTAGSAHNQSTSGETQGSKEDLSSLSSGDRSSSNNTIGQSDVSFSDFIQLFRSWGTGFKAVVYEFLAKDVNRHNIKEAIRFICLFVVSSVVLLIGCTKDMGIFILRFMHAFSHLVQALTPITMKIVDFVSKVVGFILLSIATLCGIRPSPPRDPYLRPLKYH